MELFSLEFMQRALIAALFTGLAARPSAPTSSSAGSR